MDSLARGVVLSLWYVGVYAVSLAAYTVLGAGRAELLLPIAIRVSGRLDLRCRVLQDEFRLHSNDHAWLLRQSFRYKSFTIAHRSVLDFRAVLLLVPFQRNRLQELVTSGL